MVSATPLTRSSYHADADFAALRAARGAMIAASPVGAGCFRLMPRYAEQKRVPYRPEQMFDLVADVGKYPQFLPWCVGARIRTQTEHELVADLTIGFGPFRESFTSRVTLEHSHTIVVHYENGPFKYLNNRWRFQTGPEVVA